MRAKGSNLRPTDIPGKPTTSESSTIPITLGSPVPPSPDARKGESNAESQATVQTFPLFQPNTYATLYV